MEPLFGREQVKRSVAAVLEALREPGAADPPPFETLVQAVCGRLHVAKMNTLLPVVNATGVLLHTNLGRAPLAVDALNAMAAIGRSYSNLEYDLTAGGRGSRYARTTDLLCTLTGAQDALVVNNCAAAVLLMIDTFAKGREVVVARSQLVEIGGGFRLPDVLRRGGAHLVEVGATNKTYLDDFERALSPQSSLLMRSHASNFRIAGFTRDVAPRELVELGRRVGLPVVEDLGSGALVDLAVYGLPRERLVQEAIAEGIDLVAFSGDKVLGGPQAGIIVGSRTLVARMRNNPLIRALRVDKFTIAALAETLRLYATQRHEEIPFFAMLAAGEPALRERARRYCSAIPGSSMVETIAYAGGGTLPEQGLPSIGVALDFVSPGALLERLRTNTPRIIARVHEGRVLLDLRTIAPWEDDFVLAAFASA